MDKLEAIVQQQKAFQMQLGYDIENMSVEERTAYIKEYVLHTTDELHEMLRELPYFKPWKKYNEYQPDIDHRYFKAAEEFTDVVHFILNIALGLGLSADYIYKAYMQKQGINIDRQTDTAKYKKCVEEQE